MDQLDFAAQKARSRHCEGEGQRQSYLGDSTARPRTEKSLHRTKRRSFYGLGYAMWLEVNAYGEAGISEMTLIRQFAGELPTYQQLVGCTELAPKTAEAQVPAADRGDFQQAAVADERDRERSLTFALGNRTCGGLSSDGAETANGKTFRFNSRTATAWTRRLGSSATVWGTGQTYSLTGAWSASKRQACSQCGGATDSFGGTKYLMRGPCRAKHSCCLAGMLATVDNVFCNCGLRHGAKCGKKRFCPDDP